MIEGRDSKGHFIKGNVPWNKRSDGVLPTIEGRMLISGGVPKRNRVRVTCPACGQQLEAVATDGRVKGYCAAARRYVDFLVEAQLERKTPDPEFRTKQIAVHTGKHLTAETKAKISAVGIGKYPTDETRAKLSAAKIGKHHTDETKSKISAALKRRRNAERGASERTG